MFIALCNLDMNTRFILPHNILHMTRNIPNQNQYRLVISEISSAPEISNLGRLSGFAKPHTLAQDACCHQCSGHIACRPRLP